VYVVILHPAAYSTGNPKDFSKTINKMTNEEKHNFGSHDPELLDGELYKTRGTLRSEWVYGKTFRSSGGLDIVKEYSKLLNLNSSTKVLDVGCGAGGNTFHMSQEYGATVLGMDFSANMIALAKERLQELPKETQEKVSLEYGDITKQEFPAESFDVIYSREVIGLHIAERVQLFSKFKRWLTPGGCVFIIDFCHGDHELSPLYFKWLNDFQYNLCTVKKYGSQLEEAGFPAVQADDITHKIIPLIQGEIDSFESRKEEFLKEFDMTEYKYVVDHWSEKIDRASKGDQLWGLFIAKKQ